MRKNLMRIFSLLIRYTMGLGTVLYLLRTKQIDFNILLDIDSYSVLLALVLCFFQLILSAVRVKILLKAQHIIVTFSQCVETLGLTRKIPYILKTNFI